jgi:DNA-binding NarL/FixJ family response regulator
VEAIVVQITPWDRAALQLLADGTSTHSLAARFRITERELHLRLSTLFGRMAVRSRSEAVSAAIRRGLVVDTLHTAGARRAACRCAGACVTA